MRMLSPVACLWIAVFVGCANDPNPNLMRAEAEYRDAASDPFVAGHAPLLLVQPITADGTDVGRPIVAVDSVGAGVGEKVFFVRGKEASFPYYPIEVPADAGIVGIVDHWTPGPRPGSRGER